MSADQSLDHLMNRNKDWGYSCPYFSCLLKKKWCVCVFPVSEMRVQCLVRVIKSDAKF